MAETGEVVAAHQDGQTSRATDSACAMEVEEASTLEAGVKTEAQKDKAECEKNEQGDGCQPLEKTKTKAILDESVKGDVVGEPEGAPSVADAPGPACGPTCNGDVITRVTDVDASVQDGTNPVDSVSANGAISQGSARCDVGPEVSEGSSTNDVSTKASQGSSRSKVSPEVLPESSSSDVITKISQLSSNDSLCTQIPQSSSKNASNNDTILKVAEGSSNQDVCTNISTSSSISQVSTKVSENSAAVQNGGNPKLSGKPSSSISVSQDSATRTETLQGSASLQVGNNAEEPATTDGRELCETADPEEQEHPEAEERLKDAELGNAVAKGGEEARHQDGHQDGEGQIKELDVNTCGQSLPDPIDDSPEKVEVHSSLADSSSVAEAGTKPTQILSSSKSSESDLCTEGQSTEPEPAHSPVKVLPDTKDQDKVNNNTKKQQSFCEPGKESNPSIPDGASATVAAEAPEVTQEEDGKDDKMMVASPPESNKKPLKKPDQSVLMQYLGLQPVKAVEKPPGWQGCENKGATSGKPKLGLGFLDPFSTMPRLDLMDPYDRIYSSPYTMPFEVCSEGSRSPEPPLLAETPVVGSSPPRHDYDAMEAKMINMTPRGTSPTDTRVYLATMPGIYQTDQHAKSAFLIGKSNDDELLERQGKNLKFLGKSLLDRSEEVQTAAIFPQDIPCPRCNRTFKSRSQLRGHLRWHINDPINLLSGRWQAEKGTSDDTKSSNKDSIPLFEKMGHRSNLQMSSTHGKPYNQGKGPRKPFLKEDAFCCSFCPKKFQTSLKLRGHMIVHKRKPTKAGSLLRKKASITHSSQSSFQCEVCSKVFDAKLKLRGHMISHSKEGVSRGGKQKFSVGVKKSYKCEVCFKTFPSLRARNGHQGIHSVKWQQGNNLDHKESEHLQGDLEAKTEQGMEATEGTSTALKRNRVFKCRKCSLVFATKHRVRKHLFKVHSEVSPGITSFSEEHVDGCGFCEVFKKRKRGRPKRGENTLMTCIHGKSVIGYNLPVSVIKSIRKNKMSRMKKDAHKSKKSKEEDIIGEKIMQSNISSIEHNSDARPMREGEVVQGSSLPGTVVQPVKRRGRPPKKQSNPIVRLGAKRNPIYHSNGVRTRLGRDGISSSSVSFRKHVQSRLTFLGRHMKSGWDPKKQRFIGRPYKCHLCKMSYRSERQLCSHMRTHGIHVFDLSQLPLDQRGDCPRLNEFDCTTSEDLGELELHDADHDLDEPLPASTSDSCSTRKSSESGVGGTCSVCTKEFDSDNMFHQHLLGRFNKKCRQEWMKHTFGFGMRSKVTVSPRQGMLDEDASHQSPDDERCHGIPREAADKSSGNLCVIDKIGMGSLPGTGVFTTLQPKNNKATEQVETSLQNNSLCSTESVKTDVQQLFKLGTCVPQVDAVTQGLPSPKKGAVLDAVISRLTQSTKSSDSSGADQGMTVPTESSTLSANKHHASSKLLFKCEHCAKTFDKRQKLCVHTRIHKPKIATVMDHIEHATQQSISASPSTSSCGKAERKDHERDQPLPNGVAVLDNQLDRKTSNALQVPELHLTYACTECPKHFASNMKLANHLKMHMKSTKAKPKALHDSTEKTGGARANVPGANMKQNTKRENPSQITNEDQANTVNGTSSSSPQDIKGEHKIETDQGHQAVSAESHPSEVKGPGKEDGTVNNATGNTSEPQSAPARPRLLLKINPSKLQCLYSCEDCSKSFKSRRQLAHHRRLHEAKPDPEQESDIEKSLPPKDHEASTENTPVVTIANELSDTQSDPSVGQSVPVGDHYPTVNVHKDTLPCLDETAKCKICDKMVQKGQLDDHMTSHTKGLLKRSFDSIDEKDNGWQLMDSASSNESTLQASSSQPTAESESDKLGGIHDESKYFPAESDLATDNSMGGGILDVTRDQISHNGAQNRINIPMSGSPNMQLKQLTCNVCKITCENFQQLFEHQKSHPVSSVNMPPPSAPNAAQLAPEEVIKNQPPFGEKLNRPRIYPCELCGFAFSSFRQFRGHISQTHGGKFQYRLMLQQKEAVQTGAFEPETDTLIKTHPHKCDLCGRRFKRLALLMFHLNKLHKGWKQRLCMSDARTKSRGPQMAGPNSAGGGNAGPMAGTAPGDLPFTCELCGKSFRMKVQLCGHMKTHGRVGHSPIKISPMKLKGKYTLRKRGKPDFRLSDDWILDMDDEHMASDKSVMQQIPTRTNIPENNSMNHPMDARYYAPTYPNQFGDPRSNPEQTVSRMTQPRPHYETGMSVQNTSLGSPNLPMRKSPMSSTGVPMQKSPLGSAGVPMKSPLGQAGVPMKSPLGSTGVPMKSPLGAAGVPMQKSQIGSTGFDLKVPKAPPPPDPCNFITIQLEPVSQQMLHRCLLCHSYFSSQESAVFHCKEVHFKKKQPRYPPAGMMVQGPSHPLGQSLSPINQSMPNVQLPTHLQGGMKPSTLSRAPHPLTKAQESVPSSYGRVVNPPHRGVASPQLGGVTSPTSRGVSSPPFRGVASQSIRGVSSPPIRGVANLPLKGVASQPLRAGASTHLGGVTNPPLGGATSPRMGGVTSPQLGGVTSPPIRGVSSPPLHSRYQSSSHQSSPFQPAETLPKPPSVSTGKMISQTPFNEMLYRVEMSEGQTRYVCNTCKSTFLHYNFLMSHLAEHNHLAYTCLQCGYATYSEKDYQLHCQLHDGQISKSVRRMRPKSQDNEAKQESKPSGPFPRAVATCHICQRSFVNLKGLQAHMVLHSANFSSISERRNESKRGLKKMKTMVRPVPSVIKESRGSCHPGSVSEQTEALDLSCKQVTTGTDSTMEEVLDLSMGSRSFTQELTDPQQDVAKPVIKPVETLAASLPDVCQVLQKAEQLKKPSPTPAGKPVPTARKPKNSIRLVGAIDVDVASLDNKYSIVTDLMEDSDISPDLPPSNHETTSGEGDGGTSTDHSKSPKRLRPYKCSMCQYATDFKDSMDRHEQKHRKFRTLACHQCSYRTPEKRLMLRHVLTIHEKQKPYQCKLCSYSSAYKHHLKRHHTKRHQNPLLTCTQCEFTTEDAPKLEEHCATHQEPIPKVYNCKLCSLVFDTGKLLKAHKHTVHKKKKKSKKGVVDESHSSSSIEGASESTESKEQDTPLPEMEEPASLKHQCKLCVYQTNDQNELTKHLMKNHFGNQAKEGLGDVCTTAQCPQCGYLTGKDQMKAHMQIHDSGEEFFDCEQCTFKTGSQEELDKHVQQKHKVKATAKLMCKMCGMHFWDADDMKLHTEVHLRDSSISVKNPFICSLCPLKLMNRRDALRHLQLHTDRYPFKCRHCVFSCFTKASIQRHLTIHKHVGKSKPAAARKNSRKSLSGVSCGSEDSLPVDDGPKPWRKGQSTSC